MTVQDFALCPGLHAGAGRIDLPSSAMLLVQAMNPEWAEAVPAMIRDIAIMPASSWAKYWKGAMLFVDWLVHKASQVCFAVMTHS